MTTTEREVERIVEVTQKIIIVVGNGKIHNKSPLEHSDQHDPILYGSNLPFFGCSSTTGKKPFGSLCLIGFACPFLLSVDLYGAGAWPFQVVLCNVVYPLVSRNIFDGQPVNLSSCFFGYDAHGLRRAIDKKDARRVENLLNLLRELLKELRNAKERSRETQTDPNQIR